MEWYRKKLRKLLTRCGLLLNVCIQGDYADESSFSRTFSQKLDMAVLESEEGYGYGISTIIVIFRK